MLQGLPRDDSNLLLRAITILIELAFGFAPMGPSIESPRRFLASLPRDIDTVLRRLNLEPSLEVYATCTKCFGISKRLADPAIKGPNYSKRCSCKNVKGEVCGKPLLRGFSGAEVPIRRFPYQSLNEWLARLLMRPGAEASMDSSWLKVNDSGDRMYDVWHGEAIKSFKGPDGITPFSVCPSNEGHFIFSLFVDWFNPYRNRKGGKNSSIGAMYMICLNLPPAVRFKPENVYLVGILPGPREPSKEQLNNFLEPLVHELKSFWNPGVYYPSTRDHKNGRLVKCALMPLVCDLPALRKTAGFASHNATRFCSFCKLTIQELNDVIEPEKLNGFLRSSAEHRRDAQKWKDAKSNEEQDALTKQLGVRWSILLELEYWLPIEYSVLDAMHNLLLGDFQHHCRRLLKMPGVPAESGDKPPKKRVIKLYSARQIFEYRKQVVDKAKQADMTVERLSKLRADFLQAVCIKSGLEDKVEGKGHKKDVAKVLLVRSS